MKDYILRTQQPWWKVAYKVSTYQIWRGPVLEILESIIALKWALIDVKFVSIE